jgi:glycoprotein-N-acetylgalactosamine 3-beta-galactosyltransferase
VDHHQLPAERPGVLLDDPSLGRLRLAQAAMHSRSPMRARVRSGQNRAPPQRVLSVKSGCALVSLVVLFINLQFSFFSAPIPLKETPKASAVHRRAVYHHAGSHPHGHKVHQAIPPHVAHLAHGDVEHNLRSHASHHPNAGVHTLTELEPPQSHHGARATTRPTMKPTEAPTTAFPTASPTEAPTVPPTVKATDAQGDDTVPPGQYGYDQTWDDDSGKTKAEICEKAKKDLSALGQWDLYRDVQQSIPIAKPAKAGGARLLCWVFTKQLWHKTKATAVKRAWGHRCDKLLFVSDVVDESLPSITVEFEGENTHNNLWRKCQAAIVKIHKLYGDEFDWFVKADDDTLLFVENLRKYLASEEVVTEVARGKGVYIGRRSNTTAQKLFESSNTPDHCPECCVFNAGGPTYNLDKTALRVLAGTIHTCNPGVETSTDDMNVGCCLQHSGIVGFDTRDANGGERFHIFPPGICRQYQLPTDFEKAVKEDYFFAYSYDPPRFTPKDGKAHCSPETVAFHHLATGEAKPTMDLFYHCADYQFT